MIAVLCSSDAFLQEKISGICSAAGIRVLRTAKTERIIKELKQLGRVLIADVNEELIQERGALRQMVNVGRITDNPVVCICPNQDEDLKKLAKSARPAEVFLRYDIHAAFKEYIEALAIQSKESKAG
jgi:hypothetical protein